MTFAAVFEKSQLTSTQGLSLVNKNQRPFHLGWSKRPKLQQSQNIYKQFGIWRRLLRGRSNSLRFLCRSCEGITPAGSAVCKGPMHQLHLDGRDFSLFHIIFTGDVFATAQKPSWLTVEFRFCSSSSACTIKRGNPQRSRGSKSGLESCCWWLFPRHLCKIGVGVAQKCLTIDALEKLFHFFHLDF